MPVKTMPPPEAPAPRLQESALRPGPSRSSPAARALHQGHMATACVYHPPRTSRQGIAGSGEEVVLSPREAARTSGVTSQGLRPARPQPPELAGVAGHVGGRGGPSLRHVDQPRDPRPRNRRRNAGSPHAGGHVPARRCCRCTSSRRPAPPRACPHRWAGGTACVRAAVPHGTRLALCSRPAARHAAVSAASSSAAPPRRLLLTGLSQRHSGDKLSREGGIRN
jgi:hypothetical protein